MEKTIDKIRKFILANRWEYSFVINENSKLYEDLKIYGDDAVDFFIAFSKEFNVDVSNFEIKKYFKGDGDSSVRTILDSLTGKKLDEKIFSITIGDLIRAVKVGKLDESVIGK